MSRSSYRIFLSAVSSELASYREEGARVLRRKGIEVQEQQHFRQGGGVLLETLQDYIAECDAVICLIGDQCGSLPTEEHLVVMSVGEVANRFRVASVQQNISYTQWEFLVAKELGKKTYVYFVEEGFIADNLSRETPLQQELQTAYREWVVKSGEHRESLTTVEQLIEDVLVLPFPDLSQGQPNNLPLNTLGSLFKGREQFLQDLREQLSQSGHGATAITSKVSAQKPRAVHGAGGIGKTRAAIEYAWQHATDYTALLFLSAESPKALDNSLASLTGVLSIDGLEQAPDDQRIQAVLKWLQSHPGWLAILDNVDTDEALVAAKARLAQLAQGHVVITSRLSQWSAGVETLDLGVLSVEEATSYLLEATDANRMHSEQDTELAGQVAAKVGQLALGLEHAAAWINAQYEAGFSDYLQQWEQDEASILQKFDLKLIDYPRELLVTWRLSVDQLDEEAQRLLQVLSWLSPEPVPNTFLKAVPEEANINPGTAMSQLIKYSLISRVQDQQRGFQVHRLVQVTSRYHQRQQATDNELPALDLALDWMDEAFKGSAQDVRDWPVLEPLAAHVESLCRFGVDAGKTSQEYPTSRLLSDLGLLYLNRARYTAAEPLMRRALQIDELSFGEDHPEVAIDLNNLAQLLQATNRLSEAEPLMRRSLQIDELSFDEDHPNVAIRLNNLALLLKATNRLSEAEPLMRRMVLIFGNFGKTTGHKHPRMDAACNNYIALLIESGLSEDEANERLKAVLGIS